MVQLGENLTSRCECLPAFACFYMALHLQGLEADVMFNAADKILSKMGEGPSSSPTVTHCSTADAWADAYIRSFVLKP